ncbi:MAG: redox-sensing transcriptional repressor Rex [Oscillospiraceae bacterium]|nr:redox-sensing transcriptional repressor Rex [Oscillospiraceae bacterium]
MQKSGNVSNSVIRRLPLYYRALSEIEREGKLRVSSAELANRMRLTASQIRQDLNCFGVFGQQGYGYDVAHLRVSVEELLGLNRAHPTIMIGGGNLGRAVAIYLREKGKERGYDIQAIFEKSKELIGRPVNDINVLDVSTLRAYCHSNQPKAAILCVDSAAAESVMDDLYSGGIRCYWNFSHYDIEKHYSGVVVENVRLSDSLMTLSYYIAHED